MKKESRLKTYIALLLTAMLMMAYAVNACGQITGNFKFEPHWSLIAVFLLVVGGGVFDLSVETLSLIRGYLKKGEHLLDELSEKKDD